MTASLSWQEFTSIPNGTRVFNHGFDQCVALANLYHEEVVGGEFVPVNSAFEWWTRFEQFSQLTSRYTKSDTPVAGAIFVSRGGIYDPIHGHIGVVTDLDKGGYFHTMEQNAGSHRYVGRYLRSGAFMYGFLIPKNNPATKQSDNSAKEPDRKDDTMMVVEGKGSLMFMDEMGADNAGEFYFTPSGVHGTPSWAMNQAATHQLGDTVKVEDPWTFELMRHQANARWARKRAQIVGDVVTALTPLLGAMSGLDAEKMTELISQGLEGITVESTLSDEDVQRIASAAADEQASRLQVKPSTS